MTAGVPLLNATEWVDTEAALSGSLLGRHMVCILKNDYAKDSHKCARNTALVVSGALSASAKAAFINVTLAGIPGGWGYAAAGCNVAAWFVLELWAALGIIGSSELGIPTSAQIEIRKKFPPNRAKSVVVFGSSFIIAAFSQVAPGLAAAKYNPKHRVLSAVVLVAASSLLPTRSLQLSYEAAREVANNQMMKKLVGIRNALVQVIGSQGLDVSDCERLRDALASDNYWETLFSPRESEETKESCGRVVTRHIAKGGGYVAALGLQILNADYAFEQTKVELKNSNVLGGFMAVASFCTSAYIMGTAIPSTAERVAITVYDFFSGTRRPSLSEELRPLLTRFTKLVGLAIDVGSLGAIYVMWNQFYKKEGLQLYSEINNMVAYFLLLSTAMFDTTDEILKLYLRHRGTADEKELLAVHQKLRKIGGDLQSAPLSEFADFVMELPYEVKQGLLEQQGLTLANLCQLAGKEHITCDMLVEKGGEFADGVGELDQGRLEALLNQYPIDFDAIDSPGSLRVLLEQIGVPQRELASILDQRF